MKNKIVNHIRKSFNVKIMTIFFILSIPIVYYSTGLAFYSACMIFNLPILIQSYLLYPIVFSVKILMSSTIFLSCILSPLIMFYMLFNILLEAFNLIKNNFKTMT